MVHSALTAVGELYRGLSPVPVCLYYDTQIADDEESVAGKLHPWEFDLAWLFIIQNLLKGCLLWKREALSF